MTNHVALVLRSYGDNVTPWIQLGLNGHHGAQIFQQIVAMLSLTMRSHTREKVRPILTTVSSSRYTIYPSVSQNKMVKNSGQSAEFFSIAFEACRAGSRGSSFVPGCRTA